MIRLPAFELLSPVSVREAVKLLTSERDSAILAGGTDLIVRMKDGTAAPKRVVSLDRLSELRDISPMPGGGLRIGAMATLADIVSSKLVLARFPALAAAAASVASPAIRNRATLGGNLCLGTRCSYVNQSNFWRGALGGCLKTGSNGNGSAICHAAPGWKKCSAVFCSDTAPLLIALNTQFTFVCSEGQRAMPLRDLYRNDGILHTTWEPGALMLEILIPSPPPGLRAAHRKLASRAAIDFPLANAGVAVARDAGGVCRSVAVVIGAIHSSPVEAVEACAALRDRQLTAETIVEAARLASAAVTPLPNLAESVAYRKAMVKVLVERALTQIAEQAP